MLEDLDQCDLFGHDDQACVFVVNDYAKTKNAAERQRLMAKKLGAYAQGISDGEIGDPKFPRNRYRVELNCSYDPGDLYDCFDRLMILDEKQRVVEIPVKVVIKLKPPIHG